MSETSFLPTPQQPLTTGPHPAISPEDRALLIAYYKLHADEYSRVYYNVRVGQGASKEIGQLPPEYQKGAMMSTQLRIDMLGVRIEDPFWDVVEFRLSAGIGVLGSILAYRYFLGLLTSQSTRPVVVTNYLREDIKTILHHFDITTFEVTPAY